MCVCSVLCDVLWLKRLIVYIMYILLMFYLFFYGTGNTFVMYATMILELIMIFGVYALFKIVRWHGLHVVDVILTGLMTVIFIITFYTLGYVLSGMFHSYESYDVEIRRFAPLIECKQELLMIGGFLFVAYVIETVTFFNRDDTFERVNQILMDQNLKLYAVFVGGLIFAFIGLATSIEVYIALTIALRILFESKVSGKWVKWNPNV